MNAHASGSIAHDAHPVPEEQKGWRASTAICVQLATVWPRCAEDMPIRFYLLTTRVSSPSQFQVYLRKVLRLRDNADAIEPVQQIVGLLQELDDLQRNYLSEG